MNYPRLSAYFNPPPRSNCSNWLPLAVGLGVVATAAYAAYRSQHVTVPEGVEPITDFDAERYLGRWYELARIDNRFERNLICTQARYEALDDGSLRITNRGYNTRKQSWEESTGQARFLFDEEVGAMKVSFFRPFYGGYNIVKLDPDYKWAMIVGSRLDRFWILSRTPRLSDEIAFQLLGDADEIGVDVERIIWVPQTLGTAPKSDGKTAPPAEPMPETGS